MQIIPIEYFLHSFFAKRCSKSNLGLTGKSNLLNVCCFLDGSAFNLGKICKSEHLIQEEWWKFQWKFNMTEGLKPPVICGWFLRRCWFKTASNFFTNVVKFDHNKLHIDKVFDWSCLAQPWPLELSRVYVELVDLAKTKS